MTIDSKLLPNYKSKGFSAWVLLLLIFITSGCSVLKVSERGKNGYFSATKSATTVLAKSYNIDDFKELLLVPNGTYMNGMAGNINYFDKVITYDDLETEIIKSGLQDEVGAIAGKIGINNAYRKYKKFLYLRFDANKDQKNILQLKLINPENFEDLFIAETLYDQVWSGVYDSNTFNPLFNEFIKYIQMNSATYKRINKSAVNK